MNSSSSFETPVVSVIMSVFNNEKYLKTSVDSILNQTFDDFEFLIINDGSTEKISEIVKNYSDPRIKFFDFNKNDGLVSRLNLGLSKASGKYIAIMDSDDIAHPQRLKMEVEFLENHTDYGMCFTFCEGMDQFGKGMNKFYKGETTHECIQLQLLFHNIICHPTVMMRAETIRKNSLMYDGNYVHVEDFKMWYEFSKVTKMAGIPEVLLKYRCHPGQVSSLNTAVQIERSSGIVKEQLRGLGIDPSEKEMAIHTILSKPYLLRNYDPDYLADVQSWMQKIEEGNCKHRIYDSQILHQYLNEIYEKVKGVWESLKPARHCNLCNSNFKEFYFVPFEFVQSLDAHQYIHSIFALETFNILQYQCPGCGANDIARLCCLFLEDNLKKEHSDHKILNLSSDPMIKNYLKRKPSELKGYVEGDLVQIEENNDFKSWEEESVDVLLCINELQKVEDDRRIVKELYKVLKPGGYGLFMAPIQLTLDQVYEDVAIIEEEERWKHFGHSSHKRLYSKNGFIMQLQNGGFKVESLGIDYFSPNSFQRLGLHSRSVLYVVRKN